MGNGRFATLDGPVFLKTLWFWLLRLWRERIWGDIGCMKLQFPESSTAAGKKRIFLQWIVACSSRGFGFIDPPQCSSSTFDIFTSYSILFNDEFISFVTVCSHLTCFDDLWCCCEFTRVRHSLFWNLSQEVSRTLVRILRYEHETYCDECIQRRVGHS